jgi:hypothetical protein
MANGVSSTGLQAAASPIEAFEPSRRRPQAANAQQSYHIKPAGTPHGRRYFPVVGQLAARPFQEAEAGWSPEGAALRREALGGRFQGKAAAPLMQQGQQASVSSSLAQQGSKPSLPELQTHIRPAGGPLLFGKPQALQWGAELPVDRKQKEAIANGLLPQASSSGENSFNVVIPPRGGAPIRAWRQSPPDRLIEKTSKVSLSMPDLHFTTYGKPLLKEGLSRATVHERFSESLKSMARERQREVRQKRELKEIFNITLRELQGKQMSFSMRDQPHFFN